MVRECVLIARNSLPNSLTTWRTSTSQSPLPAPNVTRFSVQQTKCGRIAAYTTGANNMLNNLIYDSFGQIK